MNPRSANVARGARILGSGSTPRASGSDAGFTLLEVMLAALVVIVLLGGVSRSTVFVNGALAANTTRDEAVTSVRRAVARVGSFVRPGKLSTISVTAVAEDVTAGRATAVGQWIAPTELVWRPGIQLTAAAGLLSMNAALSTSPRRLTFALDAGETANGADDDGDGLIDEGTVQLVHNLVTVAMLRDVEDCAFALEGRTLAVRMQCARLDGQGRVYRARRECGFYLRNN